MIFMGMMQSGVFAFGEVVSAEKVKNLIRGFEVQTAENTFGYQFHPDPYFFSDAETTVNRSEFVFWREADREDPAAKKYLEFMTKARVQRSGIVLTHPNLMKG